MLDHGHFAGVPATALVRCHATRAAGADGADSSIEPLGVAKVR